MTLECGESGEGVCEVFGRPIRVGEVIEAAVTGMVGRLQSSFTIWKKVMA